jgi:hypothetical protein
MEIEREALVEAGVGTGAVAVFVAMVYAISQSYATNGTLQAQGGLAIVGSIALFVVVLTLAGFWLEGQEF